METRISGTRNVGLPFTAVANTLRYVALCKSLLLDNGSQPEACVCCQFIFDADYKQSFHSDLVMKKRSNDAKLNPVSSGGVVDRQLIQRIEQASVHSLQTIE